MDLVGVVIFSLKKTLQGLEDCLLLLLLLINVVVVDCSGSIFRVRQSRERAMVSAVETEVLARTEQHAGMRSDYHGGWKILMLTENW